MKPQGSCYAIVDVDRDRQGCAWIESINTGKGTATVRFDPREGMRSRAYVIPLSRVDWGGAVPSTSRDWPKRTRPMPEDCK